MNDRILTVPNLVSFLRLLAVGIFWYAILTGRFGIATVIVAVVGSTDWLDGFLARRLDQASEFGKILDPLADRLMIASALIGGLIVGVVPPELGVPLLVREAVVAVGAAYLAGRGEGRLDVRFRGKAATLIVYFSLPMFYVAEALPWARFLLVLGWGLGVVGLVLYYWVAFEYFQDARDKLAAR